MLRLFLIFHPFFGCSYSGPNAKLRQYELEHVLKVFTLPLFPEKLLLFSLYERVNMFLFPTVLCRLIFFLVAQISNHIRILVPRLHTFLS